MSLRLRPRLGPAGLATARARVSGSSLRRSPGLRTSPSTQNTCGAKARTVSDIRVLLICLA